MSKDEMLDLSTGMINYQIPLFRVHTFILGSGASGLSTAAQLHLLGVHDLMI